MGGSEGGALRRYMAASGLNSGITSKEVGIYDPSGPNQGQDPPHRGGGTTTGPNQGQNPPHHRVGPLAQFESDTIGARGVGTALIAGGIHMAMNGGGVGSSLTFAALSTLAVAVADVVATQTGIADDVDDYVHNKMIEKFALGAAAYLPLGMYLGVTDGPLFTQALIVGVASTFGSTVGGALFSLKGDL